MGNHSFEVEQLLVLYSVSEEAGPAVERAAANRALDVPTFMYRALDQIFELPGIRRSATEQASGEVLRILWCAGELPFDPDEIAIGIVNDPDMIAIAQGGDGERAADRLVVFWTVEQYAAAEDAL